MIFDAGAVEVGALPPWVHSVRAVATSAAFCGTGPSPRCLRRLLGDLTLSSRLFISTIFHILSTRIVR